MPNALTDRMDAARIAEGRRRMTHRAPPALIPRPSLADVAEFGAEAFTPYGNYVSGRDAVEDFQGGRPGSGSLNALLALPGLGIVGAVGRAAKRAGKTVNALSDSERLTRAAEQGYLLDEPMFHGSNALFEVFDPAKRGASTGRMTAKAVDWAHSREGAARDFAGRAAERLGGEPVVRKLVANKEGMISIDLSSGETLDKGQRFSDQDMANFLLDRKDEGVRVVKIIGVNDSVGGTHPGPVYAILDQGAVRDVNAAKFDPKDLGRPGLTKALAGLGLSIPLVGSFQGQPDKGKL